MRAKKLASLLGLVALAAALSGQQITRIDRKSVV
jgi:hypothetical protein